VSEYSWTEKTVHVISGVNDEEVLKRVLAATLARMVETQGIRYTSDSLQAALRLIATAAEGKASDLPKEKTR
jgi:hypothetical protein